MAESEFIDIGDLHILKSEVKSVKLDKTDMTGFGGSVTYSIIVTEKNDKTEHIWFKSEEEARKELIE